jgi:7-cyano-7-deazaguanine synthase
VCSISGCVLFEKVRTERDLLAIEEKMRSIIMHGEDRGRDSYGIVSFQSDGSVLEIKKTGKPSTSLGEEKFVFPGTRIVINNDRAEPTTEYVETKQSDDIQPFGRNIYVTHNGTIANDHELESRYNLTRPSKIDSAILPPLLEKLWDGSTSELQRILRDIVLGSFALAIVDRRNPNKVAIACNYKPVFLEYDHNQDALFFTSLESYLGESSKPVWETNPQRQMTPYSLMTVTTRKNIEQLSIWKLNLLAEKKALVVCSGGLDSTIAAKVMIDRGYDVTLLHFKYRHRAERREEESIKLIANRLNAGLLIVDTSIFKDVIGHSRLTQSFEKIQTERSGEAGAEFAHEWVPARNLIFMAIATGIAEAHKFGTIVLGNNLEESIAPDAMIYARVNGSWQLDRIDQLYNKWSEGEIKKLETYSVNPQSLKLEVSSVRKVIKHSVPNVGKRVYRVTLRNGKSVVVTEDHSLMAFDRLDGVVKEVAVRQLDRGKHLLLESEKELLANEEKRELDLSIFFPILRKFKVWVSTDGRKVLLSDFLRKKHAKSSLEGNLVRLVPKTRSYSIPLCIPLSNVLLEFFGLWVSDGHFDRWGLGITKDWSNDYAEFWPQLQSYFQRVFAFPLPDLDPKKPTIMINFGLFRNVMHSLGWRPKTSARRGLHKNVPDWIFTLSRSQMAAFLRGYFSGDGSVLTKRREVIVSSVNKGLIERVNEILTILGIHTALSKDSRQYSLRISRLESVQRFEKYVGFIDQKKQIRLASVARATKNLRWVRGRDFGFPSYKSFPDQLYSLPLSGKIKQSIGMSNGSWTDFDYYRREPLIDAMHELGDGMYAIPKIVNAAQCPVCHEDRGVRNSVYCSKPCYSKAMKGHFIQRRQYLTDRNTISGIQRKILRIAESDLHYVRIKAIKRVKPPKFVYDLSVEKNENFLSANGIVLHNSGAYPDNEMIFINKLSEVLPYATNLQNRVKIEMPVGNLMKHEIVKLGTSIGAPINLTWSCYEGGLVHCGRCGPCYMRRKAFEINGLTDPTAYASV